MPEAALKTLASEARLLLAQTVRLSIALFKIMVPVSIATRILEQLGAVEILGRALAPVMETFGLPGPTGLVWATAVLTNLYGGTAVFLSLAPTLNLTVAQVSILGTMMLIAHAVPVEGAIARKAGVRFPATVVLRVGGALACGWLLSLFYALTGLGQEAAKMIWNAGERDTSWAGWAAGTAKGLVAIFFILLALLFLLRVLERIGVTALLVKLFQPVLRALGIGGVAAPVTILGMTLGVTYGGGIIIHEARAGHIGPRDVFACVSLMGLSHSLIEDTLLIMALGGQAVAVLGGRVAFSVATVAILARVVRRLPDVAFRRYLFAAERGG